jgi:hypothetical protein
MVGLEPQTIEGAKPSPEHPYAVILLGFDYDELTKQTVTWFNDLTIPLAVGPENLYRIHDTEMRKAEILETFKKIRNSKRVEVFCGHGDYDALLGPPEGLPTDLSIGDIAHAVVYDDGMIIPNRGCMFAFSCRAGKALGRTYGALEGKVFLGFKDDLPMHFDKAFVSRLRRIFGLVAQEVINTGSVLPAHETLLRRLYDDMISELLDDNSCKQKFLLKLYMQEHKSQIIRFGLAS